MDGFTGFKTAATEELNDDVTVVMDPFHVVRLAGQSLELCRRRIQQQTLRPPRPRRRPAVLGAPNPFLPARIC